MGASNDKSGAAGDLQAALRHAAALLRDDPEAAARRIRAILDDFPGEPRGAVLLAASERRCGKTSVAIDLATAVVDRHPALAAAHEELGMSLLAAGRWVEAEHALARAVALDGRLAGAWLALGEIRLELGDEPGSQDAYRKHASLAAGRLELVRAADALSTGNLAVAEQLCRQVLTREPRNISAVRLLADVAERLGRLDDAESLLKYALELAPDFHLARHDYASLLFKTMRFRQALREAEHLLRAEPNRPSHLTLKAAILAQSGETDQAVGIFDAVLQQNPNLPRIHLNKGHALKTVGRQADAVASYRSAIGQQPNLGEAYWSLSDLKTFRFDDADISRMREQLEGNAVSPDAFVHLSFALGKALEDRGEFDESFVHYSNGNSARRRSVHWDADEHHAVTRRTADFYRPKFFDARRTAGNPSTAPIFIVGMPRAGSTLLEQILASHSRVEGTMELPYIMSIARRLDSGKVRNRSPRYPEILANLSPDDLAALGTEYLQRTTVHRSGADFFIDKMPNNFVHIGLIRLILPNAKILDARRHPMACCFSVYKQLFASGQSFSYSLDEAGRYYRDYVDLMSHWNAVMPGHILRVDYESMVGDTESEIRRVLAFCDLEFEPACLEFHRTERAVRTASSEQVRQPIYRAAIDQWRNYERHLTPLKKALGIAAE